VSHRIITAMTSLVYIPCLRVEERFPASLGTARKKRRAENAVARRHRNGQSAKFLFREAKSEKSCIELLL
jgi:hypothetical protein